MVNNKLKQVFLQKGSSPKKPAPLAVSLISKNFTSVLFFMILIGINTLISF